LGDDVGIAVLQSLAEDELREPGLAARDRSRAGEVLALEEKIDSVGGGEIVESVERGRVETDVGTGQLFDAEVEVGEVHAFIVGGTECKIK
jgi:hypothetical protein